MTHMTIAAGFYYIVEAIRNLFARKEKTDIYKLAKDLQHSEFPHETVEYVASLLRNGTWK